MTCDTTMLQNRGVSFALAEAEIVWPQILKDAISGELQPVYGADQRWAKELHAPVLVPPSKRDLRRYVIPMLGIYPARGCPFTCTFCSVIKISGRQIRSQSIETTMATLRAAKAAGVRLVMFTSDNFNKYEGAGELLERMIEERVRLPFFIQCDTQVARQEEFVRIAAKAGCFQIFVGVESFSRKTLLAAHKTQNHPPTYGQIVRLCRKYGIASHFSNIIGFPEDTPSSVREHARILGEIGPDATSFYILCPIPGTEQYGEFLAKGLITERNLDRFDTSVTTWKHPNMTDPELRALLFECYERLYSFRRILRTTLDSLHPQEISGARLARLGYPWLARFSAWKRIHPMSGGICRVRLDSSSDYRDLRRSQFGIDLAPLPKNLELSPADAALNHRVKIAI